MLISNSFLQEINPEEGWSLLNLDEYKRKINRILKRLDIQQAFHDATVAYWAVQRWDIFNHFRTDIPKPIEPLEGNDFVLPIQADGSDWRWFTDRKGRKPKYWDYCLARACHWMSVPNLLLAQTAFPKIDWCIFSSDKHTGVASIKEKVLFDPYYLAVGVSSEEALELLFGTDLNNEEFCEYHDASDPYDYMNGAAAPAIELFNMTDNYEGDKEELKTTLIGFLDQFKKDKPLSLKLKHGSAFNAVTTKSENIYQLATREGF